MLHTAYARGRLAALKKFGLAKGASDVGLGYSSAPVESAGCVQGEPADAGRRQRSVVDRTFQQNEDFFSTSSMPLPGVGVSP